MTRFLVAPQWQGSPAARAMLLVDGAAAIAGDLPRNKTTVLDLPLEAGESLGTGIRRLSSMLRVRDLVRDAWQDDTIVIGGDCGVAAFALSAIDTADVAVLWCDAHPDLHDASSSPSGAFAGMALRAILGDGDPHLALSPPVSPDRVVTLGARSIDEEERAALERTRSIPAAVADADAVGAAIDDTGASRVWVHIDLDVLDPGEFEGVSAPAPFGLTADVLIAIIRRVREGTPLAGASICGFAPRSPEHAVNDLGTILRLIGALA